MLGRESIQCPVNQGLISESPVYQLEDERAVSIIKDLACTVKEDVGESAVLRTPEYFECLCSGLVEGYHEVHPVRKVCIWHIAARLDIAVERHRF